MSPLYTPAIGFTAFMSRCPCAIFFCPFFLSEIKPALPTCFWISIWVLILINQPNNQQTNPLFKISKAIPRGGGGYQFLTLFLPFWGLFWAAKIDQQTKFTPERNCLLIIGLINQNQNPN